MDLPEPLRAGFALAATIAGDNGAQCAARALHPGIRAALTALPEDLAGLDKPERRARVRVLAARFRASGEPERAEPTSEAPLEVSRRGTRPTVLRVLRAPAGPATPKPADVAQALRALAAAQAQQHRETERAAVEIGLAAASHILGRALELEPTDIAHIVSPLLARVRRAATVRLHLHPDDAAFVRAELPALSALHAMTATIEVVSDPSIARGGCVLESNVGELDARVDTRIAAIAETLTRAQP